MLTNQDGGGLTAPTSFNELTNKTNQTNIKIMEENNKVFKRVKNQYYTPYIYDTKEQCLRQLQFIMTTHDVKAGTSEHQWRMAETGEIITGDLEGEIYSSEAAFNCGNTIPCDSLYEKMDDDHLFRYVSASHKHCDNGRTYIWVYENGQAVKWFFDERINEVVECVGKKGEYPWKTDVEIPESYSCVEEVFEYNDYEVVHNDGTREYHEGVLNRLTLTPEQKALADKLQATINECKEAGMGIIFDYSDYNMYAFNKSNVKEVSYDADYDEDTEERYHFSLKRAYRFNGISDANTDDDYYLIIKKDTLKTSK